MRKNFVEVMKEICEDEGISLQQLSKILKVTKKELEEYQSGQKKPNLEFMAKFCKEFDLSLDYFLQEDFKGSEQEIEGVTNKRNKIALFDQTQGKFITPFLYDIVFVSPFGYHIVMKKNKEISADEPAEITYRAFVDNYGNVKTMKNYDMIRAINQDGTFIGRSKKDKKFYLVDIHEKTKSQGFDRIDNLTSQLDVSLLVGINFAQKPSDDKPAKIKNVALLSKSGVIPIAIFPTNYLDDESEYKEGYRDYVAPELDSIEDITNAVSNYGISIIELIPHTFFERGDNFVVLMEFIIKYENECFKNKNRLYKSIYKNELLYAIETLYKYAQWWEHKFDYGGCKNAEHYLFSYFADQALKDESLAKEILNFYKEIGAIKE